MIQIITGKTIFLVIALLAMAGLATAQNILVYTRNGQGYVHDNIETSVEAIQKLADANGWQVTSSYDPSLFTESTLARYDCIIFSNTNNEAFLTDQHREAFQQYIHNGGAFVGIHSASGSERNWPWFAAMLGGRFVRHPKLQPFTIKVIDHDHPATSFMDSTWEWTDECYFLDHLNPDIRVLLAADLRSIEDEEMKDYPGDTFGNYTPISWCHEFEGGRQFYTALGHKKEHYNDELFLKHLLGGIRWALGEK